LSQHRAARRRAFAFAHRAQLYSVRELLPRDFDGTLRQVRAAGYTEVEAAGYFNKTRRSFKKSMDGAGLRCVSTHHPMALLQPHLDEYIEYGKALGLEYMICPSRCTKTPRPRGPLTLDDGDGQRAELTRSARRYRSRNDLGLFTTTTEFRQ